MISHRFRTIFIHQRKTAGCSIISSFGIDDQDSDWHVFNNGTLDKDWENRDESIRDYTIFTVIRNPWDRFVSGWKYLPKTRERPLIDVLRDNPDNFTPHEYRHLFRPQIKILLDANGTFIPHHVLRYEYLAQDYENFCEIIGKQDRELPHLNAVKRRLYSEYFDDESRQIFDHHFRRDLNFLGYHFDRGQTLRSELREKIPGHPHVSQ